MRRKPSWIYPLATLDLDFVNQRYYAFGQAGLSNIILTTRASVGYAQRANNTWVSFDANQPRITDKGIFIEQAATNLCLYSNDLTNAAWTKTNCTAALNATGADGVANAATTLTATGANATCLQAFTLSSAARTISVMMRRKTGSGAVYLTQDNDATRTDITSQLNTSTYTKVQVAQTLVNPTIGIKLATSGDAVEIWNVQYETGSFATSPIFTTSATVTRSQDVTTFSNNQNNASWANMAEGSLYVEWEEVVGAISAQHRVVTVANSNAAINVFAGGTTNKANVTITDISGSTIANLASTNSIAANTVYRIAIRWRKDDMAMAVPTALNATVLTDTTGQPGITYGGNSRLGQSVGGSQVLNGYVRRLICRQVIDADANLQEWANRV